MNKKPVKFVAATLALGTLIGVTVAGKLLVTKQYKSNNPEDNYNVYGTMLDLFWRNLTTLFI